MMAFPATFNRRSMNPPSTVFRSVPLLALLVALAAAPAAHARNDAFELPVDKALSGKRAREIVGDLPLRFGGATTQGTDLLQDEFTAEGVASIVSADPYRREHLKDEETCQLAFESAVNRLAQEARRRGAAAVVGIVSAYKDQLVDDPRTYDCHAGVAKSYVTLRARFARTWTETSARPLPRPSEFAALDDVKAVPISDAGRERYAYFLTLPKPRAFVVYEDGAWRFYAKDPEAMAKALDYCARQGRRCWLYAADDRVVWNADVTRRIGSTSQLEGGSPKDEHQ
jgi:uncharacterized protein YbjQ (UPF0145 family)